MSNSGNDSDIADQAYELGNRVDRFVDERPLTALALAVLVGALFARYLFSSRPTDQTVDLSETAHGGRASDFLESLRRRIA